MTRPTTLLLLALALPPGCSFVAAGSADPVSDLAVPIDVRNASGLPRYVVGGFSIGGVTQHATFDAGNPTMPIFMSQICTSCETGCPATVPQCTASAPFCTPSAAGEFAPMGSYENISIPCEQTRPAGKLGGTTVCMGCFGGASHSRFFTMAKADVTINAETPLVLPGLTFGALVRTAPAIDRIWGNVGVGFGSTWLAQLNITVMCFHLRTGAEHGESTLTFNPSVSSFSMLPSAPFTVTSNRQVALALLVGGQESGGATFHIDTGNSGISIADAHITASLASSTGGSWSKHGSLTVKSGACSTAKPITVVIGAIRIVIPGDRWCVDGSGRTIFATYHKNVLGLPFIMSGDMIFDDANKRMYFNSSVPAS